MINEYLRNLLMIKKDYYEYNYNHFLTQDILSKVFVVGNPLKISGA